MHQYSVGGKPFQPSSRLLKSLETVNRLAWAAKVPSDNGLAAEKGPLDSVQINTPFGRFSGTVVEGKEPDFRDVVLTSDQFDISSKRTPKSHKLEVTEKGLLPVTFELNADLVTKQSEMGLKVAGFNVPSRLAAFAMAWSF